MDPAFLRRLPYKIEIGAPSVDLYKSIFMKECKAHGSISPTRCSVHRPQDHGGEAA